MAEKDPSPARAAHRFSDSFKTRLEENRGRPDRSAFYEMGADIMTSIFDNGFWGERDDSIERVDNSSFFRRQIVDGVLRMGREEILPRFLPFILMDSDILAVKSCFFGGCQGVFEAPARKYTCWIGDKISANM